MDTISFGASHERSRWPGWLPRRRVWLALLGVAVAVTAVVLLAAHGHARRIVPELSGQRSLLAGVRARGAHTDLVLGGEDFWRVGYRPRAALAGFLSRGLSPLLPPYHAAVADQLAPVRGGVVALITDRSAGLTYGALGRVVFIPAAGTPARVIARATVIAVAPGGRRVWVQTGTTSARGPANSRSPTWAVSLAGGRTSPVLHLPLGLAGATGAGPLTENLGTGKLRSWNGATGRPMRLPLPAHAVFIAAGRDRVIWLRPYAPRSGLQVTDLRTGTGITVPLPGNWIPPSATYPPPLASFDPSGQRLVLLLDRIDPSERTTPAEDLFVADIATRTLRMIPGGPLPLSSSSTAQSDLLAGSWDSKGLLWVLAMSPRTGCYQLGFWTGAGPLRTLAPARGAPIVLSAPGPG